MNKKSMVVTIMLIASITAVAGFFAGMKYQQSRRSQFFTQNGNRPGNNTMIFGGLGGTRSGARPVSGEIIKADETSVTVKLQDGSSKIIMVSETTNINIADKGTKSDLITGTQVIIFGSENTDGSISALNIQINPIHPSQ